MKRNEVYLCQLSLYPLISELQAVIEADGGLPAQLLQDEGIIGISAPHTLRSGNVADWQLLVVELLNHLHHLIHAHLQSSGR